MLLNIDGGTYTVDVDAYKPHYESSIVWKCIGGIWRGVDYGLTRDHYSSTVTVSGAYGTIHTLRDAILQLVALGGTLTVTCDHEERIFGHEFGYGPTAPYDCLFSSKEEPFTSIAPDGSYLASWTFTLLSITNLITARWRYAPSTFPDLKALSVDRSVTPHAVDTTLYNGFSQVNFGVDEPTCTVKWFGTSAQVAQAKSWLISRRKTMFTLTSPSGINFFTNGMQSQSVYFYDIVDSGNIDQASQNAEISVTYLLI